MSQGAWEKPARLEVTETSGLEQKEREEEVNTTGGSNNPWHFAMSTCLSFCRINHLNSWGTIKILQGGEGELWVWGHGGSRSFYIGLNRTKPANAMLRWLIGIKLVISLVYVRQKKHKLIKKYLKIKENYSEQNVKLLKTRESSLTPNSSYFKLQ